MLREALEGSGAPGDSFFDLRRAPLISLEAVDLAHDPAYVRAFVSGTLSPQAQRRIGFPWSQGLVARTLASTGGTLEAARAALEQGIAGGLAGGTHHAFRDEGSGFCVFNDIAVAIRVLQHECRIRRAAAALDSVAARRAPGGELVDW